MKEIELKPCPFCEGKAEITSYHNAVIFVQCTDCYATFPHFDSKEEAIEAWNRRADAGYRKQSEGEWISAENPPDDYRDEYGELIPFLACCKGTVYPFRAVYDGKNWGDGIGRLNVTHWMPLPEPPKGD